MVRYGSSVLLVLVCLSMSHAGDNHYTRVADISYLGKDVGDDYAQTQCRLDVYAPKGKTGYATIVWFHGGGLKGGKRQSGEAFAKRFTKEGFGVVLVSYRLFPKVKCPVYIEDSAAAVAWTIGHIAEYNGDPRKVFLSGHSAGGYLTAMLGLDASYLAKHKLSPADLAGLMPVAGQMVTHTAVREERGIPATKPLIDEFAPAYHVTKDAPPFLCIAGSEDAPARAEENIYFTAAMKSAGHKQIECLIVPGRNHGSIAGHFADSDDPVAAAMLAFMNKAGKR